MFSERSIRPPQAPIIFNQTARDLLQMTQEAIKDSLQTIKNITSMPSNEVCYETVIVPFVQDDNRRVNTQALTDFYQHLSPSLALRDASIEAESLWNAHERYVSTRSDLYLLLTVAKKTQEKLDPEEEYYLDQKLANMIKNGASLPSNGFRERFKDISLRIDELSSICEKTLRRNTGGMWCSPEELSGLPEGVLRALKPGEVNSENNGKVWLGLGRNHLNLCLKYCQNADTRMRAFIGSENKCLESVNAFKELVARRAELAELLNYSCFADYKSQNKMMSLDAVNDFLAELKQSLKIPFDIEMQRMIDCKRSHLLVSGEKRQEDCIYLWDADFYTRLLQESQQDLDEEGFSEFFPLNGTVAGLLKMAEELFGIVFVELDSEDMKTRLPASGQTVWHEDVQMFSMWNEDALGGEFLGYFYLDLLEREGKRDHPCNITFQAGFDLADGQRQYPSTILLASFPHATVNKPTLLLHRQILTLFHELGHAIHYLVGATRYAATYGTSASPDFVEVPSKMLENWCWDASILQRLSKHYTSLSPGYLTSWKGKHPEAKTPEDKASLELLQEFVKGRENNLAFLTLKQIWLAEFDIAIHSAKNPSEVENMNLSEMYNRLRYQITGLQGPDIYGEGMHKWGCGQARFSHMFGDFYAAGYYCYAVASVYSVDLIKAGFGEDLMNQAKGRKYRELVVGRGGSRCAMEFLEEFLGRKPGSASFASLIQMSDRTQLQG